MVISAKNKTSIRSSLSPLRLWQQLRPPVKKSPITTMPTANFMPINPTSIPMVNPTQTIPTVASQPKIEAPKMPAPRKPFFSKTTAKIATLAAGATALLMPAVAYAGVGEVASSIASMMSNITIGGINLGPVGIIATVIGTGMGIRVMWNKFKSLKAENLQSSKSRVVTNNPTPSKILKTLVLPYWGAMTAVGAAMAYLPAIESAVGAAYGTLGWGAFYILAGVSFAQATIKSIRDVYHAYRHKVKFEQTNLVQAKLVPKIITNYLGKAAWVAGGVFMAHISKIYATQFIGMCFKTIYNVSATATTGAGLGTLAGYGLIFGGIATAYHLLVGRPKQVQGIPLKKAAMLAKTTAKAALIGVTVGAAAYFAGGPLLAANLFIFAIAIAFGHNFIHSARSQEGGLVLAEKKRPVHDLRSLWKAVRGVTGDVRTIFKPGIDMIDPLISTYIMSMISEGAHTVLNAASGCYSAKDYGEAQQIIKDLINKDTAIMRQILKDGYDKVQAATTVEKAYEAAETTLETISKLLDDDAAQHTDVHGGHPIAWGDLKSRSGLENIKKIKDSAFRAGYENSTLERSDQDLRVHGEHIRFTARLYEEMAKRLRANAQVFEHAKLDSVKKHLAVKLDAAYCRSFPHCDTHPGRFWTNFLPDSYNAKQFIVDLCMQVMADFVGAMEVAVLNPHGKIEIWLVPMRIVKDFKPDYKKVMTIESRDKEGEDLRFAWYDRFAEDGHGGHDIGDSLCEIAYIDNSAHWQKHGNDLKRYPTAEVLTVPDLASSPLKDPLTGETENQEFYDVVYKNETRLRVFADGSHRALQFSEQAGHYIEVPAKEALADAAAVLMVPETKRHQHVAKQMAQKNNNAVLYGIKTSEKILNGLSKADVPHPWGGSMSTDKYLKPRRRFMYPTLYYSISDADQMDLVVTNLRLYHTEANPHLRVMTRIPKEERTPFSMNMIEKKYDSFLEAGVALTWMLSKIKLTDGRELYIPINLNKENENTFSHKFKEMWRYINHEVPLEQVKKGEDNYLLITLRTKVKADPALKKVKINMRKSPMPIEIIETKDKVQVQIPMPREMEDYAGQIAQINIDPVRYGEVGGPIPVMDYFFVRRKENGNVTDASRRRELSNRVAEMLLFGITNLLSKQEIEHMELVGQLNPRAGYPWVDKHGVVHMQMSDQEYEQLEAWLPEHHGQHQPVYKNGAALIDVKHFEALAHYAYEEFTYRRFMPDHKYRNYFEASETW